MCGIHAAISKVGNCPVTSALERRLRNRGPDHIGSVTCRLDDGTGVASTVLTFTSTVLALRGDHVTKQPLVDTDSSSVLCWNGEAWKIQGKPVEGNDGEAVLALLTKARQEASSDAETVVLEALRSIEGPFAFIYFDKPAKRLYYGRDRLGRRSLLVKGGEPFFLASISDSTSSGWSEVEADGCYVLQLNGGDAVTRELVPTRYDWVKDASLVSRVTPSHIHFSHLPLFVFIYLDIRYRCFQHYAPCRNLQSDHAVSGNSSAASSSDGSSPLTRTEYPPTTEGFCHKRESCRLVFWRT